MNLWTYNRSYPKRSWVKILLNLNLINKSRVFEWIKANKHPNKQKNMVFKKSLIPGFQSHIYYSFTSNNFPSNLYQQHFSVHVALIMNFLSEAIRGRIETHKYLYFLRRRMEYPKKPQLQSSLLPQATNRCFYPNPSDAVLLKCVSMPIYSVYIGQEVFQQWDLGAMCTATEICGMRKRTIYISFFP